MKRKILLTGGMGLVGGRVAQSLHGQGDFVILGSRRAQAHPSWLATADVVVMDWMSMDSLVAACHGVDAIVHLAAMNHAECLHDPVAALEVNGVNTVRLVEAAKIAGVGRFIYFSTAHIYGAPLAGYIDEGALPRCLHPYATSHRAAEDVVLAANDKLSSIVLRLSNGFGRPAHAKVNSWMLLVNDLCLQAVTKGCMTLRSSGLQKRDFITLHDVGAAVSHILDLPNTKIGNGLFNIGSGESMRVIEMAELIQSRCSVLLGFTPDIVRPAPHEHELNSDFSYVIDKLLATGFVLSGNPRAEIDGTLIMCNEFRDHKEKLDHSLDAGGN
jgi:UDP-glucose 4-epimerase